MLFFYVFLAKGADGIKINLAAILQAHFDWSESALVMQNNGLKSVTQNLKKISGKEQQKYI